MTGTTRHHKPSGPSCSKLGLDNPGLVQDLNSDLKAYKAFQLEFFLSTS